MNSKTKQKFTSEKKTKMFSMHKILLKEQTELSGLHLNCKTFILSIESLAVYCVYMS